MMVESDLIKAWLRQLARCEEDMLELIREVSTTLPHIGREGRRVALAKLEMLCADIEKMIRSDPSERPDEIAEIHSAADELAVLRAGLDRKMRDLKRQESDLDMEQRRSRIRQLQDELERADASRGGFGA